MRKSLDDIDAVLVSALGERARLSRQIADVKADGDGPVRDADRETALLQHRSAFGERLGLDPAFVRRIFREILDDSVRRQQDALQTRETDVEQEIRVGLPGHRRRVWPPGRAAALRGRAAPGRLQGLRHLQGDARSGDRRACRSRDAADRKHHRRLRLRVVRFAAALQPLAGRRRDRRRAALPAGRGGCAARIVAPHSLASAGVVAVQRVPVRRCRSARA